ncbi:unnamed protein product [Ilex paraguariensis]|uniref:Uncharacterized protein n=1 Tax=Ilex paraguariensis TaxID=185542 RepID=A0ABC8RZ51_9AQUA
METWQGQSNPKSNSEKYNPEEGGGSGVLIEPSRGSLQSGRFHGQLMQPGAFGTSLNVNKAGGQQVLNKYLIIQEMLQS